MPVTFDTIKVGDKLDRTQLAKLWGFKGRQPLDRGVMTPKNDNKIILFIQHEKQIHAKQFTDVFKDDTIQMDGQPSHRTDNRLIHAAERGDEIHLFYRELIKEPFTYYGQVEVDLQKSKIHTDQPSKFIFRLLGSNLVADAETFPNLDDVDIHTVAATEGRRRLVLHLQRERNQAVVRNKKKQAAALDCEVCGFSFGRAYGNAASDYCEAHHLLLLSAVENTTQTRVEDLAILCANCHRVVHLRNPPYTLDEVRRMLALTVSS
ncbi:MAG TPA: HNH endonuclease [Candidatus Limnocylindrales bacterium]|nr:HNH endonuclease [Candidatus Limnocylindrales bacterium]